LLSPLAHGGGLRKPPHPGHGVACDDHRLGDRSGVGSDLLNFLHDVQTHMLAIKPLNIGCTNEELRFVCAKVASSLLTSAKGTKVHGCVGSGVGVELHHDPASKLGANLHVEENLRV
jgi:hypothetical protein